MTEAIAFNSFPLQAGQDVDLNITVVDSDGVAKDLTGASLRFAMARGPGKTPVIDSAASPQTATYSITDAANGLVTVSMADTITDSLSGDYYYEVKVTDGAGAESITNRGWITVELSLT